MHRLETSIEINATATRIWSLLTDFPGYKRWNPFVRSIEGALEVGQALEVFIQPPGSSGMRFRPTVLAIEPQNELRWKGKLLISGLFDGEHYFLLDRSMRGGVTFRHGEVFTGLLVPFFRRTLDRKTRPGFVAMNEALKREAEKDEG